MILYFLRILTLLVLGWGLILTPRAQLITGSENTQNTIPKKKAIWMPPARFRNAIEQQKLLEETPRRPKVKHEFTPWLSPKGERLVGVVEDRMLTKAQLDLRVKIMLQHQPPLNDPIKEEDRRITYEGRILDDWAQLTTLAVQAEHEGFTVTPAEIDQSMQTLSAQSVENVEKAGEQMRMIGIPEQGLRQELADGILVEKMMRARVEKVSDADLQKIFNRRPETFLEPTRVNAWQLFQPSIGNGMTRKEQAKAEDELTRWAKRLRKCRKQEDYQALLKELGERKDLILSYVDNIADNEPLPPPVMRELFGLEPGETSKVVSSKLGLHVVKVIERKQGHRGSLAEAKPQIQNYLIEKSKDVLYENIKSNYQIYTDATGLRKSREVGPSEPEPLASPATATTADKAGSTALAGQVAKPRPRKQLGRLGDPGDLNEPPPVEALIGEKADRPVSASAKAAALAPKSSSLEEAPPIDETPDDKASYLIKEPKANLAVPEDQLTNSPTEPSSLHDILKNPPPPGQRRAQVDNRKKLKKKSSLLADPPSVQDMLSKRAKEDEIGQDLK